MLTIVDGNNIVYRAFYGKSGLYDGFKSYLQPLSEYLIVVFDGEGTNWRKSIYTDYKGNRGEKDPALSKALEDVRDWLIKIGVCVVQLSETYDIGVKVQDQHEGDDVIASLTARISPHIPVLITSADQDYLQLVGKNVRQNLINNKGNTVVTQENCKEITGVESHQIVDLKALVGDKSDNYGGITGIGSKTAIELLNNYQTFENIYGNLEELSNGLRRKLLNGKSDGEMCKQLAAMKRDLNLPITREMCKLSEETILELV